MAYEINIVSNKDTVKMKYTMNNELLLSVTDTKNPPGLGAGW